MALICVKDWVLVAVGWLRTACIVLMALCFFAFLLAVGITAYQSATGRPEIIMNWVIGLFG